MRPEPVCDRDRGGRLAGIASSLFAASVTPGGSAEAALAGPVAGAGAITGSTTGGPGGAGTAVAARAAPCRSPSVVAWERPPPPRANSNATSTAVAETAAAPEAARRQFQRSIRTSTEGSGGSGPSIGPPPGMSAEPSKSRGVAVMSMSSDP
jgi:hypothetical protein